MCTKINNNMRLQRKPNRRNGCGTQYQVLSTVYRERGAPKATVLHLSSDTTAKYYIALVEYENKNITKHWFHKLSTEIVNF